jgi:hypothetical protein
MDIQAKDTPELGRQCSMAVSINRRFNRQHPPDPMTTAGDSGLPVPGFFLTTSFDGPQAFSTYNYVSFLYA